MRTCCIPIVLIILAVASRAAEQQNQSPAPRKKADLEAVLAKAPKPDKASLRPLNILLVAGPKDHGPGEHDYPQWQKDWTPLMKKADAVTIDTAWKWPTKEQLDKADLVVCYFKSPWDEQQVKDIAAVQVRGGGFVSIHWAIAPDDNFERHQAIVGLNYKGAAFRHGVVDLKLVADHPIVLGLPKEMRFTDEPYWPILGDRKSATVLATSDELLKNEDAKKSPVPVFWTYEKDKGRAFVSIFGHYMWTFDDPYFRLMLLRGMAWAAGENDAAIYRFDNLATEGVKLAE